MALETVAVLGGGAWGTALAQAAAMAGRSVTLVLRNAEQVAANVASMSVDIPAGVWSELRAAGIITANAPVPGAA